MSAVIGTARERRRAIVTGIVVWITLGTIITIIFRDSIVWVQAQSYLAILISLGAWYSAETPVEKE